MIKSYHKSFLESCMFRELLKFEKSKYPVITVAFYCLIVFSVISVLLIMKNNFTKLEIKNFISPIKPVTINIQSKKYINSNAFVCYDNDCMLIDNIAPSKIYYSQFQSGYENSDNKKIKNITLAYPNTDKNFISDIDAIDLYIGNEKYYLSNSDLSQITPQKFKMEIIDNATKKKSIVEYNTLLLSDKGNYRGIYTNICSLFLSLFYNWQYFIIPYFWLFLAFVFYLFNRDEIKFKIKLPKLNPLLILGLIVIIGVLLRCIRISYYPLWTDEVYTKTVAIKNFFSCFKDAGNPPLFFIFEYLITRIIGTSDIALRFLPLVFGVLIIPCTYFLFNKINTKIALFASFMVSINTILIYHSTEARGYTLSALLIILSIWTLFEYLKNQNPKNLFLYALTLICSINHNYYLILFAFANFIWGIIDLIEKKNKKSLLLFLGTNIIASFTFIPYLIISSKIALSAGFNGWIPPLSVELFKYAINFFFINKYIFLFLCIVVLINLIFSFLPDDVLLKINLKKNNQKSDLLIYLVFNLALIIILASLISIFIKPIFHKRILLSIYMLLLMIEIINISGIVEFVKENIKIKIFKSLYFIILCLTCFSITYPMPLRELCRLDDFMHVLEYDVPKYEKQYEIHCITCDTEEYLDYYPEVKKLNIKWHYIDTNSGFHLEQLNKFDYIDKNKNSVIYFHGISADISKIFMSNPNVNIFKSNSISTGRLIYEAK